MSLETGGARNPGRIQRLMETCTKDIRSWRQGSLGPNLGLVDLQRKVTLYLMRRGHHWTTADYVNLDWPKLFGNVNVTET